MFRQITIGLAVAAFGLLALAPGAAAKSSTFTAKPTKITCVGMRLGERSAAVRCDLPFLGRRAAFLHTRGKARIKAVPRLLHPPHPKRLGRGQQIRLEAFTCTSLRRAVTCRSHNGHGFTVGKSFQLTF